jgi:alpha-1,3-rhamnosyl/mannosyltransferase
VVARICVDCSPLLVRSAGVKTYIYQWVTALRALYPEAVQTFLEPRGQSLDHRGGLGFHPTRLALLQTMRRMPGGLSRLFLPPCDLFHTSTLTGSHMAGGIARRPRLSATVHDMTAWTVPWCHRTDQVKADHDFADRVIRNADGLIAVSESTRNDAVRILRLSPDRIHVVYPGVAERYFNAAPPEARAAAAELGLATPYFVVIGTIEPRKNIDTILSAWMSLPGPFRRENRLVFAGMPGWKSRSTLRRLRQLANEDSGVRYLGYVPEALVPGLIAGALALVCPSYYEGFGFPLAQAMAAGCPVIASNVASLPEVAGGCAVLVDPRSAAELARALVELETSPEFRERLSAGGRQRACLFTWERSARESFRYLSSL